MLVGLVIFQIMPATLIRMFNDSPDMIAIGVPALRIISISFIFAGAGIISSSVFQALGNGLYSLIMSVVRQIVFIVPVAYVFALTIGLDAVWFSFPIAEISSILLAVFFLKKTYDRQLKELPE